MLGLLKDYGASRRNHGADDHPQIPRSGGFLRRRQRAQARRQDRRRPGRRTRPAQHGGNDDRRRGRAALGGENLGLGEPLQPRNRGPVGGERRGARCGGRLQPEGARRRNRRHRGRLRQRAEPTRRGAFRPASDQARPGAGQRQGFRAQARPFRQVQGVRIARGAAEERDGADDVGRREHGVPRVRQAADRLRSAGGFRPTRSARGRANSSSATTSRRSRPTRRSAISRAATCSVRCWRANSARKWMC